MTRKPLQSYSSDKESPITDLLTDRVPRAFNSFTLLYACILRRRIAQNAPDFLNFFESLRPFFYFSDRETIDLSKDPVCHSYLAWKVAI